MNDFDFSKFKDFSISSLKEKILSLKGEELSIVACILAFVLTSNTTINEQNSIGNFFELVGQFILTSAAQNYKLKSQSSPSISDLENQIEYIMSVLFN